MKWLGCWVLVCCFSLTVSAQNWPSFRGAKAVGIADGRTLPTTWNAEPATNILWKTAIPGLAHSCPIVWGDRVYMATAIRGAGQSDFRTNSDDNMPVLEDVTHTWQMLCLDKNTGRVLWTTMAHQGIPKVKRHLKATQANATPATDGRYIIAMFGSEGLFCFTNQGKLLWRQDLGMIDPGLHDDAAVQWGHSSSPIIYKNLAIVQCDGHAQSFVAAYDLQTGKRVWRVERGEMPSWSTPTVYEGGKHAELVTNAPRFVRAYDPLTGKELWRFANSDLIVQVPTPFLAHGMFYVTGGWPGGRPIKTIRPGAKGDISLIEPRGSNAAVAWQLERGGPYVPTPIVYGDYLYSCNDRGVLTVFNAKTGEQLYQQRINDQSIGFSASPVAGDGKLFFASEDGDVYVLKAGSQYALLSINPMGEPLMASPAISDGTLFIRGQHHLFAVRQANRK